MVWLVIMLVSAIGIGAVPTSDDYESIRQVLAIVVLVSFTVFLYKLIKALISKASGILGNKFKTKNTKAVTSKNKKSKKRTGLSKFDAFDEELNPDGISLPLNGLDEEVWEKGYYFDTDEGTWYELYAVEHIRAIWGDFDLSDPEERERFEGFSDFDVSMFEEYGQINFFVAVNDTKNDLDALTEKFI